MKKILSIILVLTITLGLGACDSSSPDLTNEVIDLQEQIDDIEVADLSQIELDIQNIEIMISELELRLDNMVPINGINGYLSFYENSTSQLVLLSGTLTQLKETLDTTKLPDYALDSNNIYISFDDVMAMLKLKYFGIGDDIDLVDYEGERYLADNYFIDYRTGIIMYDMSTEFSGEELIARMALLIVELQNYEYYLVWSSTLDFSYTYDLEGSYKRLNIIVTNGTLIGDYFIIEPDAIMNEKYEMLFNIVDGTVYDIAAAQQYYDDFVTNGTFIGYVLDFK